MANYASHLLTLPSELFALSLHPTKPLLAAGLSSGHLQTYTWPSEEDGEDSEEVEVADRDGEDGGFKIAWQTRRHKGSCRCVAFSGDGEILYSTGTDSLLKAASSHTGQVTSKTYTSTSSNPPTALLPLSPHHLLLGTENGMIHLLDTRTPTLNPPSITWKTAHDDYISSLTSIPASTTSTTGFARQFISTGDTTLCHLDVRKPSTILSKSEDQEDELLCSAYISDLPQKSGRGAEKVLTGLSGGVVALWNKGEWKDQSDRINISKASGESVDAVCVLPEDFSVKGVPWGRFIAAGAGNGKVRIVRLGGNNTVATLAHSLTTEEVKSAGADSLEEADLNGIEEGVTALDVDCGGRIVSGGGKMVKVWYPAPGQVDEGKKRAKAGSDSGDSDEGDSSEEEERERRRKKKRKGGKGKARSVGVRNVAAFKGLD